MTVLQIIRILLHRLENLIFLGTQPLNLLHLFIFLHSVGISLPDEFFLTHIPSAYCSYSATRCFYNLCLFLHSAFSSCRSSAEKQINALRSRSCRISSICSACFICTVSAFRTMFPAVPRRSGFACRGLSTAATENLQLNEGPSFENTIFHQLLAVAAVDLAFQRDTGALCSSRPMFPMLQHDDLLCLFKIPPGSQWRHDCPQFVPAVSKGARRTRCLQGTGIMNFAPTSSFILLIFQNMVNRSTCPMAALQIPCFLLTVHMVFRHMIRCRGRDLLFIQDFAMVPVLLPCNASSKINRTYRLATGSRIGL